ncbi:MAG: cytochrome P460 family protein [Spirochaetales bacterium]|nr:cytochrome P460 family protein [Spirochaetales bacterium]
MKKTLLIFLLSLLYSCDSKLENLIPDNHEKWPLFTHDKLDYFIPGHENNYRISYINEIGAKYKPQKKDNDQFLYNYPEGTIILKEIYPSNTYQPGDIPEYYTVMIKKPGHPHAQGDWVWLVKNHESKEETIFHSDMCVNCHEGANTQHPYGDKNLGKDFRDYTFFTFDGQ